MAAVAGIAVALGAAAVRADTDRAHPVAPDDQAKAHARMGEPGNLADLVARLLPSVVSIVTTQTTGPQHSPKSAPPGAPFNEYFRDYFNQRRGMRRGSAVGSGFIIDPSGYIVTNNHVVARANEVKIILHNGRKLDAKIIGKDPRADLALLKVTSKTPLPAVKWGNSDVMRIGDTVVAMGNPFGLGGTVTRGIISARHRHLRNFGGYAGQSFVDFLQTDAAINKGNSGGPLFNLKGEVIGINTAIYSRGGTNVGIAFSIPASLAAPIVEQLRKYHRTRRGWLGVRIQDVDEDLARSLGMKNTRGALVANVVPDSPAAKGGVLAGDVILKFDGRVVPDSSALPAIVAAGQVGKAVKLLVLRRKKEVVLTVKLGELEKAIKSGAVNRAPNKPDQDLFPELGMKLDAITPELARRYNLRGRDGVVVTYVDQSSYAWSKNLRPGDRILEMDMTKVKTPADVRKLLAKSKTARKLSTLLLVERGDNRRFVVVRFKH